MIVSVELTNLKVPMDVVNEDSLAKMELTFF